MTQKRYFCRSCTREWVFAKDWDPASGACPICGDPSGVTQKIYQPSFPGGDLPRDGQPTITLPQEPRPMGLRALVENVQCRP